jgi:ribosome maturation factor RimP
MGARRPFFMKGTRMATTYETERQLQRDISRKLEAALPGVEVLAVELQSPSRFCVYVDHAQGVDHALCERVTNVLRGYLDRYTVDVSSPGTERPLRTPGHFRNAVGREVAVRTAKPVAGRTKFRGELVAANSKTLTVAADPDPVEIPYDAVVRGNLIDEVTTK